jgi:hypothetical protein
MLVVTALKVRYPITRLIRMKAGNWLHDGRCVA